MQRADDRHRFAVLKDDPEVDPGLFRRVLGRFATGITVVTTKVGRHVHGMTANAFMSGSLIPPLVVVSIAHRAKLHGLLHKTRKFGISILSVSQETQSSHFAGQSKMGMRPEFAYQFGIPVLYGALASIAADVTASYECGDHTLFVGRVLHLASSEGDPLLYYAGAYRQLSESDGYLRSIDFVW